MLFSDVTIFVSPYSYVKLFAAELNLTHIIFKLFAFLLLYVTLFALQLVLFLNLSQIIRFRFPCTIKIYISAAGAAAPKQAPTAAVEGEEATSGAGPILSLSLKFFASLRLAGAKVLVNL